MKVEELKSNRTFCGVFFVHEFFEVLEGILSCVEDIDEYFYILHDKDDDLSHYHLYVKFNHYIPIEVAHEWLNDMNFRLSRAMSRRKTILDYFLHRDRSNMNAYKYSLNEIKGNIDLTLYDTSK